MSDSHTMPPPMGSKSTNKVSGVVKFYSVQKCYGFIKRDDTNEFVFVHSKSITGKNQRRVTRSLAKGEYVEFDVMMSDRSPEAINVTGINGGPVVGSEYGLISMQWHQYNAYKSELLRNGEHGMRDQSPRARRFFHRRRNITNHSGNRGRNQQQHHNQKAVSILFFIQKRYKKKPEKVENSKPTGRWIEFDDFIFSLAHQLMC